MLFVIFALYCQGTISVSMLFIFDCLTLHRFNSCTKLVIFGLFCVLFGNKMHLICIFEQKTLKCGANIDRTEELCDNYLAPHFYQKRLCISKL